MKGPHNPHQNARFLVITSPIKPWSRLVCFYERFLMCFANHFRGEFMGYIMNYLAYWPRNKIMMCIMNHFAKLFMQWLPMQSMNHFHKHFLTCYVMMGVSCALVFHHAGCRNAPIQHACPDGMIRGDNFVCTPIHGMSSSETTYDDLTEKTTESTREKPRKTCPETSALLSFHEVLIDPEGPDKGREWIELRVLQSGAMDGSRIIIRKTSIDDEGIVIDLNGHVETDAIVLIADDQPQSIPFACDIHAGCLPNTGGVVELYDCEGNQQDLVEWGYASATNLTVRSGFSFSWCEPLAQWALSVPTPGQHEVEWRTADTCPAPCKPPENVWINEVLYDLVGADNGGEFVELISDPHTDLSQVTLWAINGYDGEPFLKPMLLEGFTDENGFYLIGGTDIDDRDATLAGQLQNGPEAMYLEACDGTMLDAVTYGGDAETLAAYGGTSPILPPGQSLGRTPNQVPRAHDMHQFVATNPTPRAINAPIVDDAEAPPALIEP